MSLRSQWDTAKNGMSSAGVKVSVFSKDFGGTLDAFEKADKAYQAAGGGDPAKLDKAKATRKAAAGSAYNIGGEYGRNIRYLEDHATDAKQKTAIQKAGTALMPIMNTLKKAI
jgi:hypothetical protein